MLLDQPRLLSFPGSCRRCWRCLAPAAGSAYTPAAATTPSCPTQYAAGDERLQALVDDCLAKEGVLLALARYSKLERARPPPSTRCAVLVLL